MLQGAVTDLLGGRAEVDFTVDRAGAAIELLIANGLRASVVNDSAIRVDFSDGDRGAAAAANRLLVTHGFAVSAMEPRKHSLEDLYRTTLTNSDGAVETDAERRAA